MMSSCSWPRSICATFDRSSSRSPAVSAISSPSACLRPGNPTRRELLKRTRAAVLDAYQHEWTPFALVFGTPNPLDDPRGRVLINYLGDVRPEAPAPTSSRDVEKLRASVRFLGGRSGARNDAFFMFNIIAGSLHGIVGAAADRFDPATVRQRAAQLCTLIRTARLDESVASSLAALQFVIGQGAPNQ